jgi:bifunctional non-homologous end joining protein LigD
LVNLGSIGLHPWPSRVGKLQKPDYATIDLDPHGRSFDDVVAVALVVHRILERAKVRHFVKTSGKTGLHILIPTGGRYSFGKVRAFCKLLVERVREEVPQLATLEQRLAKRRGKIYLDIARNAYGQTAASAYSLRAYPGATVSTPLTWGEVKKGLNPKAITIKTVFKRLKKKGDLLAGVAGKGINLRTATRRLKKS